MAIPVTHVVPSPPGQTNKLALTAGLLGLGSVVFGLLGLLSNLLLPGMGMILCCGVGALLDLVALVLGIIALVQIKRTPGQGGSAWAIIGIVFGAIAIILIVLSPVLVIALLTIMGPVIGNVFSKINNSLMYYTPMP